MIDEDHLRERVRSALLAEVPAPRPGFEARVISALEKPPPRRRYRQDRWLRRPPFVTTAAAIVLAAALVTVMLAWPRTATGPAPAHTAGPVQVEANARIPASSTRDNPRLQFFTPDTGWVILTRGETNYVYKTADGGATWAGPELTVPAAGGQTTFATRFFDRQRGITVAYTKGTEIWRTEDGGKKWFPVPLLLGGALVSSFDFINTKEGWLLYQTDPQQPPPSSGNYQAGGYYITHTVDAGDHWTTTKAALEAMGSLRFLNPSRGFLAGTYAAAPLQRTRDGGATWQRVDLTLPEGASSASSMRLRPPGFFNSHDGVMVLTAGDHAYTYTTTDGGETWSPPKRLPGGDSINSVPAMSFANPDSWWFASDRTMWTSGDGGKTWRMAPTLLPGMVSEIDAVDYSRAWILSGGLIYRTTDGGASWLLVTAPLK